MSSANGRRAAIAPSPSREEAAAIIAAVERFRRAVGGRARQAAGEAEGWRSAALVEAVEAWPRADLRDPWINT